MSMTLEKRARTHEETTKETSGKDYAVCDQCRIKKIRCGREKPFCSNCTRLGHRCEWSGNGKKCNQTTLLSHTIEGLNRRLESLEAALAETQDTVKRLVSGIPTCIDTLATLQPSHTWPTPEETTFTLHETAVFKRPIGHFLRSQNVDGSERYFSPTSLESLVYNIRDIFLEPLVNDESGSQSARECALLAQQKLDDLVLQNEEIIRNGAPPTAPPISILKAMIEPYFATVNPHFPVWTRESFMRIATTLQETNHTTQDLGLIVCSNNLILMTLAANLSQPPTHHQDKPSQSRSTRNGSSIDLDLMNGFLANAKRAIEYAELLLSPRLINVQALLSLCVIAQEHMSPSVFARLFNFTAQCARSIGIHDWDRCAPGVEGGARERQCLSYCLYILDKVVCSTVGTSPCIPAFDVHIDSPAESYDDTVLGDLIAKAKLAEIQETIYLEIYARRAPSRTADQARLLISKIDQKLQDWLVSSGGDSANMTDDTTSSSIGLSIGFACTQLLYMQPFKEHPEIAHEIKDVARRTMKLLLRAWHSAAEPEHQGAFPRIIASYPPLHVFEVFASVLGDGGQDSDLKLLESFIEMLHNVTDLRAEESHNHRLYEAATAIMAVATATKSQHKRRKTHHTSSSISSSHVPSIETRRLFPYSPTSDVLPSSNETHTPPRVQGGSRGTAGLAVSTLETLMSPTNSGGCPEDELATIMGPLREGPFEPFDLARYGGSQIPMGESLIEKELWWD
ncbi:fungal-specific transcription factor domain-containing protein [Hypoxylon sp. FL1150]|nr:fungal-specific transcription factor domain-containing protein [Hypoxylon sp. FL1150]